MDIIEFSDYMFLKNKTNKKIQFNLDGIENNKDLFLFLIDLFCKGLVMCYGGENSSVDFEDLNLEKFDYIKNKMQNAGIITHLTIEHHDEPYPTSINKDEIYSEPDNKPLEQYIFKIYNKSHRYEIRFGLRHNV